MEQVNEAYFKLMEISEEEKKERNILARLVGPVASCVKATRNDRKYNDELWEKIFDENKIVNELLKNGGIPGELQHPLDGREEVDNEKIAIMLPEKPRKDKDGRLVAYIDIVNTPCGNIAYALAKYGFKFGISSRGTGDTYEADDGTETVDPETYNFKCFDLCTVPALEDARLTLKESLEQKDVTLKKALTEALSKANDKDKKIMSEALEEMKIDINNEKKVEETGETIAKVNDNSADSSKEDKKPVVKEDDGSKDNNSMKEAENNGSEIVKNLTEAVKEKSQLESQLKKIQEELALSNAKVTSLEKEVSDYKFASSRLSVLANEAKTLTKENSGLRESLDSKISECKKLIEESKNHKNLTESYSSKQKELSDLNESLKTKNSEYETKIKKLEEDLANLKKLGSDTKVKELTEKLNKSEKMTESYKKFANKTVNKFIESIALYNGVSAQEVKSKLPKTYTFEDVERLAEDLSDKELSISKLPFNLNNKKLKVAMPKKSISEGYSDDYDETVDEDLLKLARII